MRVWGFDIDGLYTEVILNASHLEKKSLIFKDNHHHRNNSVGVLYNTKTKDCYYFNRDIALHEQVLRFMKFDKKDFIFVLEYPDKIFVSYPEKKDINVSELINRFNILETNIEYID